MADQQIAVLIDYENVGLGSIQWLFDQMSDLGRVIVKRAYADWSLASNQRNDLLELGIDAVHLFQTASSGKNASDIRLAIDAIELLYGSPVDTFVIVSSDSDFVPLVSKLRAAGKTVIGAGRQGAVSRTLVLSCDRYFYLEKISSLPAAQPSKDESKGYPLLIRAVNAAMDNEGKVNGAKLHQTLLRLDPSFDFRALGYATFTKFLESSTEVKVTRPKGPGDVTVELQPLIAVRADDVFDPDVWGPKVDDAWSQRAPNSGQSIVGSVGASGAAAILGLAKLSESPYKTLQRLLEASDHLRSKWRRDGNSIVRR